MWLKTGNEYTRDERGKTKTVKWEKIIAFFGKKGMPPAEGQKLISRS